MGCLTGEDNEEDEGNDWGDDVLVIVSIDIAVNGVFKNKLCFRIVFASSFLLSSVWPKNNLSPCDEGEV